MKIRRPGGPRDRPVLGGYFRAQDRGERGRPPGHRYSQATVRRAPLGRPVREGSTPRSGDPQGSRPRGGGDYPRGTGRNPSLPQGMGTDSAEPVPPGFTGAWGTCGLPCPKQGKGTQPGCRGSSAGSTPRGTKRKSKPREQSSGSAGESSTLRWPGVGRRI